MSGARASAWVAAACAGIALAASGCGRCGAGPAERARGTLAGDAAGASAGAGASDAAWGQAASGVVPPAVAALAHFHHARPLWLAAPPAEPGLFTIDHIYRPVLSKDGRAVILASTALGCTALDLTGGAPLWRAALPAPAGPVEAGHLAPSADPRCPSDELTCLSPHPPAGPWPPTPVATAAGNSVEVRDETLYAIRLDTATPAWTASGRYADCAGCLGPAPSGALWALALDSGTIARAGLDPATGRTAPGPDRVPAIEVLAAAPAPGAPGSLYAALRLDSTLTHDAVVALDAGGRVTWSWLIPAPRSGPRVDPVALLTTRAGVVVFFDGRYAAGLPPP